MHGHTDNYTFLTQGPLHRVIITMAIPTIISMLVTGLYNIADTFFVSDVFCAGNGLFLWAWFRELYLP